MELDPRTLRTIFGRFATGVTLVTVPTATGGHGMTANSFTSVSLEPPLVLICVDKRTDTHALLLAAHAFAVNVLPAGWSDVSDRFARGEDHSLQSLETYTAVSGAAVLEGALAFLDCAIEAVYPGGDHDIVLGRILAGDLGGEGGEPLIFFSSRYRQLA